MWKKHCLVSSLFCESDEAWLLFARHSPHSRADRRKIENKKRKILLKNL
jgi:hypothetical protein